MTLIRTTAMMLVILVDVVLGAVAVCVANRFAGGPAVEVSSQQQERVVRQPNEDLQALIQSTDRLESEVGEAVERVEKIKARIDAAHEAALTAGRRLESVAGQIDSAIQQVDHIEALVKRVDKIEAVLAVAHDELDSPADTEVR